MDLKQLHQHQQQQHTRTKKHQQISQVQILNEKQQKSQRQQPQPTHQSHPGTWRCWLHFFWLWRYLYFHLDLELWWLRIGSYFWKVNWNWFRNVHFIPVIPLDTTSSWWFQLSRTNTSQMLLCLCWSKSQCLKHKTWHHEVWNCLENQLYSYIHSSPYKSIPLQHVWPSGESAQNKTTCPIETFHLKIILLTFQRITYTLTFWSDARQEPQNMCIPWIVYCIKYLIDICMYIIRKRPVLVSSL